MTNCISDKVNLKNGTNVEEKMEPKLSSNVKAFDSLLSQKEAYDTILTISENDKFEGCIKPQELAELIKNSSEKQFAITAYDGFEPSGRMHIAQGLLKTVNVNKLTKSGVNFIFYVADWFAQLNNKLGGDLKRIRKVGEYFIQVWTACGMDLKKVKFVWASEEINNRPNEYWSMVMDLARKNSITRIKRCGQIMGRTHSSTKKSTEKLKLIYKNLKEDQNLSESEFLAKYSDQTDSDPQPVAELLYPLMQCTDIFFLKANICQLGMDQLKVNVLAREFCDSRGKKERRLRKPVIVSHHMLMGLKEGQAKMSKSDPDSAIFMEDSSDDVKRKIRKAFCRPRDVETNPILDYLEHIVFAVAMEREMEFVFRVERAMDNGGDVMYENFEQVRKDFADGKLHPKDLKVAVVREINVLLEPVRKHFESGSAKELLKQIKSFR